jgi:hypothetical protein
MDLEQRTRTSQSFIYVECGPRPLPFAFPNSTSAESAFFVQVDYFRFARHSSRIGSDDTSRIKSNFPNGTTDPCREMPSDATLPASSPLESGSQCG